MPIGPALDRYGESPRGCVNNLCVQMEAGSVRSGHSGGAKLNVALALVVGLTVGFVAGLFSIRWATRKTEEALRDFDCSASAAGVVDKPAEARFPPERGRVACWPVELSSLGPGQATGGTSRRP
jgi:hypothetical protein